jgi:hypothetical protein
MMAGIASVILALGGTVAIARKWDWWAIAAIWGMSVFCFFYASYGVWLAEYKKRIALDAKLLGFPRLRFPYNAVMVERKQLRANGPGGMLIQLPEYEALTLRLINDPETSTIDSCAAGVNASIQFRDPLSGRILLGENAGRWADTPQPSQMAPDRDINEMLAIDFPVGRTRCLDIAIKYRDDEECYAMNNDSYSSLPRLFRDQRYKLPKGTIQAAVRLRAANVDCSVMIEIINDGVGVSIRAGQYFLRNNILPDQASSSFISHT